MGCKLLDEIDTNLLTDEDYIKLAYLALLRRKIDDEAFNIWMSRLAAGTFRYKDLLDELLASVEFIMCYKNPFHQVLHEARQAWFKTLERFDRILDIGGSSARSETGTLIELGYRHRPSELVIFDLPPEEQYWGAPKYSQDRDYKFSWGVVKYVHGRAEEIYNHSALQDKSFDCVFMGQVIEHIEPGRLNIVLKWIRDHLKDNGAFIFDTPNRDITRIQSPQRWMDMDHKREYTPDGMEGILNRAGFKVVKKTGLVAMPESYRTKEFNPLEVYETKQLSADCADCYIFAFECKKG